MNLLNGHTRSSVLKKNIIASIITKGISIATSFLMVPLTLNYVNKELYGIWLTLSSIIMWLNFFDIGFTLGLKNKLAEALAVKDYTLGKKLVSTTYYMMLVIFILLLIIILGIIPFINWSSLLNVDPQYEGDIIKVLDLLTLFTALQMFLNVLSTVVSAYQKIAMSSIFTTLGQVLSLVFIFILTKTVPPSLITLAIAISIAPIIVLIFFSICLYKGEFRNVSPSLKFVKRNMVGELFGMGIKFFIIQMQVLILYQSTNLIISHIAGPTNVTQYNIAYKYLSVATMVYNIILAPLWPAFTDAYTLKDYAWMRKIYRKMCYIYLCVLGSLIVLTIIAPFVYKIWVGDQVNVPAIFTICIAIFLAVNSWDSLQVYMINGIGAIKLQTYIVIIGLVCHIPLALFLGNKVGAVGVVLSMTCINIIYTCVFTTQINKLLNKTAKGIWIE